ncbi:MAG TPA: RNA polymerase sigma factor RpoD/SigA [Spirochaetales bacterium]|nr:RNA polymerase sigma factor RpoD/SigA [Spirochaetales bacterium]
MCITQDYNETLAAYFQSIRKIKLLTKEEEANLARRVAQGDKKARQRLVEANLRLVVRVARSMWNPSLSLTLADMIQEGNIGLLKAAEKFDGNRNVRFSTYAVWWIRQAISRALINTGRTIRLPHRKEQLIKKIHAESNVLRQSLKRNPTRSELSVRVGLPESKLEELLSFSAQVMGLDFHAESEIDEVVEPFGVLDTYEDFSYAPERAFDQIILKEQAEALLLKLPEKERSVLEQRFEFNGKTRKSLKKMGKEMHISPETVRLIEKRALKALKNEAEKGYLCLTA